MVFTMLWSSFLTLDKLVPWIFTLVATPPFDTLKIRAPFGSCNPFKDDNGIILLPPNELLFSIVIGLDDDDVRCSDLIAPAGSCIIRVDGEPLSADERFAADCSDIFVTDGGKLVPGGSLIWHDPAAELGTIRTGIRHDADDEVMMGDVAALDIVAYEIADELWYEAGVGEEISRLTLDELNDCVDALSVGVDDSERRRLIFGDADVGVAGKEMLESADFSLSGIIEATVIDVSDVAADVTVLTFGTA